MKQASANRELAKPLAPEEFSSIIGLHVESIRRAIRSGRIKAKKFGPYWRIPRDEAERILQHGLPSEAA